jgi:hypothetical protein
MKFTPSYYDGSEPYGSAYATRYLNWFPDDKSTPDTISAFESAFLDYALVVLLDRNIGDEVGYMGYDTYNSKWNGGDYWDHIGYDIAAGQRPVFVSNDDIQEAVAHSFDDQTGYWMRTFLDTGAGGQSGGPLYGTFNGGPRIVGVTSSESSSQNVFGGGPALTNLIAWARQNY